MTRRALLGFLVLAGLILAGLVFAVPSIAVEPSEILKDSALEARARDISKGLRCVVCQNQSIDGSAAQLARDLRVLVRERLVAGDSDRGVVDYVRSRYGDYVLLRPPMQSTTMVLWLGPVLFALIGIFGIVTYFRRQKRRQARPAASAGEDRAA
jgi:cytochrome c-type biogenesis protein CcmH